MAIIGGAVKVDGEIKTGQFEVIKPEKDNMTHFQNITDSKSVELWYFKNIELTIRIYENFLSENSDKFKAGTGENKDPFTL